MTFESFLDGVSNLVAQVRKGLKPGAMPEVLRLVQEEARRRGHSKLDTAHLLLVLLQGEDAESSQVLTALGANPAAVCGEVEALLEPAGPASSTEPRMTRELKQAVMTGMYEARTLKHEREERVHFLLGILRDRDDKVAQVLYRHGVTFEAARSLVESGRSGARPLVRLDDRSDKLLYEQIVEQVSEAVATGRLAPGDRLPAVRQLADELNVAPGTVARAFTALEDSGVIVSDGARGTFVAPRGRSPGADQPSQAAVQELLRTAAVAAFHSGSSADEVRAALEQAMKGIFTSPGDSSPGPAPGTPSGPPPPR